MACITVWLCPVNLTDSRAVFAAGSSRRRDQWSTGSFILALAKNVIRYIPNILKTLSRMFTEIDTNKRNVLHDGTL